MAIVIADRVPTSDNLAVSGYYYVVLDGSIATSTNGYYYPQSDTGCLTEPTTYLHLPQQQQQQHVRDPHTVGRPPPPFANAICMRHHGVSEAPAMAMQHWQSHTQVQVVPATAVSTSPGDPHSAGSSPWTAVDHDWDSDNFSHHGSPRPGSPPVTTYNQAPMSPVSWPSPISLSSPGPLPYQQQDDQQLQQQQQQHIQAIPPARISSSPAPNDNGAPMYHAQQMAGMYSPTCHPFVMDDRLVVSEQQQSSPTVATAMPAAHHQHLMQTSAVPLSSNNGDAASMSPGVEPEDDEMALEVETIDLPYAELIYKALLNHPRHAMTLQEVYQWFENNTQKDVTSPGWHNSVRHNLSLNKAFQRREQNLSQGDCSSTSPSSSNLKKPKEWYLEDWAIAEGGVQSTTKYRSPLTKKSKARCTPAGAVTKAGGGGGKGGGGSHANQVIQQSRGAMGGGASGRRLSGQRGGRGSSRQRNLQRLQGIPEVQVQMPPPPPTSNPAAAYPGSSTCTGITTPHHWDVMADSSISIQLGSSGYLTPDGTQGRAAPQDGFDASMSVIDEQAGVYYSPGGTTQGGGGDYSAEMSPFGLSDVEGVFPDGGLFARLSLRGPHGHVQECQ
ncbi:uncharacterized protein DNG_09633 [Cephalotrichum gorgonifer]|uniref:Fork-head domain-containing protein n=1 Tax=Cephalotrichum gorgonifer TaxID=2041049 RepID=A0AAE8N776_9PEZI|nr:uncharacterized protein DNG_09633 [Cephalotrichum gorgonifer]